MPRRSRSTSKAIYQLKITLEYLKPPVWRRLIVPADIPLDELHVLIQEAMGWTDSHLHQFSLEERHIGDLSTDDMGELGLEDERKVRLKSLVGPGQSLSYEYDFGDGWVHTILVEKDLERDPRFSYPLCIGGARACPPEDCGGPPGYEDFLAAMKDPKHPEHDATITWIGGAFDPEGFDLNQVNMEFSFLLRTTRAGTRRGSGTRR